MKARKTNRRKKRFSKLMKLLTKLKIAKGNIKTKEKIINEKEKEYEALKKRKKDTEEILKHLERNKKKQK